MNVWVDLGVGNQSLPAVSPRDFLDYQPAHDALRRLRGRDRGADRSARRARSPAPTSRRPSAWTSSPVSANFFQLLRRGPDPRTPLPAGRGDASAARRSRSSRTALWTRATAPTPRSSGGRIVLDGVDHTVVGVCPRPSACCSRPRPFSSPTPRSGSRCGSTISNAPPRNFTIFTVFGRLKPGVTFAQAQAEMEGIAAPAPARAPRCTRLRHADPRRSAPGRHRQARASRRSSRSSARSGSCCSSPAPTSRNLLLARVDGAAARDGAARGARRRRPAPGATAGDRKRSCSRPAARSWGCSWRRSASACCRAMNPANLPRMDAIRHRRHRAVVHGRHQRAHGHPLRARPGAADRGRRSEPYAAREHVALADAAHSSSSAALLVVRRGRARARPARRRRA